LRSARVLFADGDFDGAASRAYYAMFDVAEAPLLSKGLVFSSHSAVISAFAKELTNAGAVPREYHRYFLDAQEARNVSDYKPVSHVTEEEARLHIEHAEELLTLGEGPATER
jgi:uncharacterized protein (UPF0332 family)